MRTFALLAVLFSVGCATAYQPVGYTGGYTDSRLGPDAFTVWFQGNRYTAASRVSDFTMLRAAELTLESGYRYFVLLGETDKTRTTVHNGQGWIKPGQETRVHCLMGKPKDGTYAYEAEFIRNEMRRKYRLEAD